MRRGMGSTLVRRVSCVVARDPIPTLALPLKALKGREHSRGWGYETRTTTREPRPSSIFSQIRTPNLIVFEQRCRGTLHRDLTVQQNIAAMRDRQRDGGILFDHQNRRALRVDGLDNLEHLLDQYRCQTH